MKIHNILLLALMLILISCGTIKSLGKQKTTIDKQVVYTQEKPIEIKTVKPVKIDKPENKETIIVPSQEEKEVEDKVIDEHKSSTNISIKSNKTIDEQEDVKEEVITETETKTDNTDHKKSNIIPIIALTVLICGTVVAVIKKLCKNKK